jgi:hypothetical protein
MIVQSKAMFFCFSAVNMGGLSKSEATRSANIRQDIASQLAEASFTFDLAARADLDIV